MLSAERSAFRENVAEGAFVSGFFRILKDLRLVSRKERSGAGGEIQLTDAIASLMKVEPVHALPFTGIRYDCGSKIGYLRATVEYGLRHPELGAGFRAYLQNVWER